MRPDLNNRHHEREEAELRHRVEYDHHNGAPVPNCNAEREDRRRQEAGMRRRTDYEYVYNAPGGAYNPPRHDNGRHRKAPPVQYYLNDDDDDTVIDGFTAFTPRLRVVDWPATLVRW